MKIGIDPGHGGSDPGAVSPVRPAIGDKLYTEEEDITLAVALDLKMLLEAAGHQVVMTRTTDTKLQLWQRSDMLNKAKVQFVISLHCNSSLSSGPDYIATFIQGLGGQAEKLAKKVQVQLAKVTGWKNGGVRVKDLHMTRETKMPAILVEMGFVSNPAEERQMNDPAFRLKIAQAIAAGVGEYVKEVGK